VKVIAESRDIAEILKARPIEEWHEDYGNALWWRFPIEEPPYVGSPLWYDWIADYYTHWSPIPLVEKTSIPKGKS
jgi:hypothetical protein